MKKKWHKVRTLVLLVVIACMCLSACGKPSAANSSEGNGTAPAANAQNASGQTASGAEAEYTGVSGNTPIVNGKPDTSKFVTVKMLMLGDPPAGGADKVVYAELNKILKERMNAELEVTWIEWNNYETKYQMELVSGTPYDLIFTTSTWLNLWGHAEKDAFMDMKEMIPYYAPQIYADTTEAEWAGCTYKGEIVALPEHRKWQLSTPVFAYRADWAKEFGIEKVDSMETLAKYCEGIIANKADCIPYNVGGGVNSNELYSMWLRQNTDFVLGPGSVGMSCPTANVSYDDCWSVASPVFDEKFLEFANLMKEWGDKGFWPEDVMSATVQTEDFFLAGKSGLFNCNVSNYFSLFGRINNEGFDIDIDAFFFDEKRGFAISDVMTQDSCSISANAQNPERALMMYDLFQYDPDIYHLTQYGVKGVHWTIDEEGYRVRPEGYNQETDSYSWNMWSTRNDALELAEFNPLQGDVDAVVAKIKPWSKMNPWGSFILDTSNIDPQIAAINEAGSTWLPAIQFGKAGDPAQAVEKYRQALTNAGIESYITEVERQMQEYNNQ
ncbi:MAG: extracellular solute-binding protein [Clostridiales bacterium]|jgi:putative aldouronate transport system substrate-binding protein|nr:extracellular solute-binding protein [Clostridiales bacterium]